jgi:hypothetical protein
MMHSWQVSRRLQGRPEPETYGEIEKKEGSSGIIPWCASGGILRNGLAPNQFPQLKIANA